MRLARRSRRYPAAGSGPNPPASGPLRIVSVREVAPRTPACPDSRSTHEPAHLRALAFRAPETCRVALRSTATPLQARNPVRQAVQFSIAAFLLLTSCSSLYAALPQDQAHRAVWEIHNLKPGERFDSARHFSGTTFAIESGTHKTNLFVTNAHVLYGLHSVGASLQDVTLSQKDSARTLSIDRIVSISGAYDLALFETTTRVSNYLDLTERTSLQPGLQHSIPGYPLGIRSTLHQTSEIGYQDLLSFSFAVNSTELGGASGAPILNRRGNVVGVQHSSHYNMAYGVKFVHLKRLIEYKIPCLQPRVLEQCLDEDSDRAKQLATDGNPVAQYQLTRDKDYISIVEYNSDLFAPLLKEASAFPFPPAIYELATYYYNGERGFRLDEKLAFGLYVKCARQHDVACQYFVALLYAHGTGTYQSWKRTKHWFLRAADQGHAPSQYELATMYLKGLGVDEDREWGTYWMERAAWQGHDHARRDLKVIKETSY